MLGKQEKTDIEIKEINIEYFYEMRSERDCLKAECESLHKKLTQTENDFEKAMSEKNTEIAELKCQIESMNTRMCAHNKNHQSDCITINQLNVTIDILVDKLAQLRKYSGLS